MKIRSETGSMRLRGNTPQISKSEPRVSESFQLKTQILQNKLKNKRINKLKNKWRNKLKNKPKNCFIKNNRKAQKTLQKICFLTKKLKKAIKTKEHMHL